VVDHAAVLVAQLSDPHIAAPGERIYDGIDSAAGLRRAIAHIARFAPPIAVAFITGDLVERGTATEYEHLAELLAPVPMPLALMPGNHDDRDELRRAFPGHLAGCGERLCRTIELDGLRLVLLDSHVAGQPGGAVGDEQLRWLDDVLSAGGDLTTIVAIHHPPFSTGVTEMDAMGLADSSALAEVIVRHHHVALVVCGHLHRPIVTRFAGTVAMTAPSTSHQLHLELRPGEQVGRNDDPAGVLIHRWHPTQGLTSHVSVVPEN
jgi:3',5'-cyclic-AMP phosphodiesterase